MTHSMNVRIAGRSVSYCPAGTATFMCLIFSHFFRPIFIVAPIQIMRAIVTLIGGVDFANPQRAVILSLLGDIRVIMIVSVLHVAVF